MQPGQEDHRGRTVCEHQVACRPAQEAHQLLVDDLYHLLARRQVLHHLLADRRGADTVHKRLDDFEVDVGLQQRQAHFAQGGIDVRLGQHAAARQPFDDLLEAALKSLKHQNPR
jgi:hypothetical protein